MPGTTRAIAVVAVALATLGVHDLLHPEPAEARSRPQACLPPLIPCAPVPQAQPAPAPPTGDRAQPISLGLTESDARLLNTGRFRRSALLGALKPRYVRVLVDWNRIQPRRRQRPNWDAPPGGCPRSRPRCKSAEGLRTLLKAIRARAKADGGWEVLVVLYFTPRWAARPKAGCERRKTTAKARMPRIAHYRKFLRRLQALGNKLDVDLDYWTPWNEPNHPAFLNPQRRICDPSSPPLAPALYAQLARAAGKELRSGQQLVIGELAGLVDRKQHSSSAPEFIRALPPDVACGARAFAQHAYIGAPGQGGRPPVPVDPAIAVRTTTDKLATVDAALRSHGCEPPPVWITETGTFDHRCEAMAATLETWARNPQVEAAFQYTFREATGFPVGLVSRSLRRRYDSYRAWRAFADAGTAIPKRPCG